MGCAAPYARGRTISTIAHGLAGGARIRYSLRPLVSRGRENYLQTSGGMRRENAKVRFFRHCERSEAIHAAARRKNGLLRCARNDGEGAALLLQALAMTKVLFDN